MIAYATTADLQAWLPSSVAVADDAEQLLRSASIIVARAVNESPYDDSTVTTPAKRDATCAQVAAWLATGVRPGGAGLLADRVLKARQSGGTRFEYDTNRTASADVLTTRKHIADDLAPEARAILQAAGILWVAVASVTGSPGELVAPGAETPTRCDDLLPWWRT